MYQLPSESRTMRKLDPSNVELLTKKQKDLETSICDDTILCSIMYVNNEMGSVMPVKEIGEIIREKKPDIIYHVDAIQAFGKYEIHPRRQKIDMLSVSSHKIRYGATSRREGRSTNLRPSRSHLEFY